MIVIGVTGGIASGKSVVCGEFAACGGIIIEADQIGHEMLARPEIQTQLREAFGTDIFETDGSVNRRRLGTLVFRDTNARLRLNAIVHPPLLAELRRRIDAWREQGGAGGLVIDAALLIEWDATDLVDVVVVVTVPEAIQLARLMERNGLSEEEAHDRIASQFTHTMRLREADYIIDASGSLEETKAAARMAWEHFTHG